MELKKLDLTASAEVHWRNPSPHQPDKGERKRRFASLTDAIRFVVEDLTDFPQSTATIETKAGALAFDEIKLLYAKL
jgi:hypothetical protein